jgi:hypothetical protein
MSILDFQHKYMRTLISFLFLFSAILTAQSKYPQDYFRSPLDITTVLSGTFGELRSNHFHAGLDIKTQGQEGLNIYAVADGYVSRIKIAHFGYGKAVYITHPNGYTTVYGHLQRLSPILEAYIKKLQYKNESFEVQVFPEPTDLPIKQGEIIALSGNTGGSGGPHLHFEIRDNQERPINPMLFGLKTKDTKRPNVKSFYAYPLNDSSHVNGFNSKQKLRLIGLKNGDFKIPEIKAYGQIGFGVESTDRHDLAGNNNGVFKIESSLNGVQNFEVNFERVSFNESKHINRFIDYPHYKEKKKRIQKIFKDTNNPLSIFSKEVNNGIINVLDSMSSVYKVTISDFETNKTNINLNIRGVINDNIKIEDTFKSDYLITRNEDVELTKNNISVTIPKNTFYEDFYIDFKVENNKLTLHNTQLAASKYFTVTYDISEYKDKDLKGLYIARLIGWNNYPSYQSTKRIGNVLFTKSKYLGTYNLAIDSINPTIKPVNFTDGKWLSKYRFLKLQINDKQTGIKSYRATVNGKFILMEYDYKKKTLIHDFNDKAVIDTKNNLKVIVTDNVGNSTTFEATFFRK